MRRGELRADDGYTSCSMTSEIGSSRAAVLFTEQSTY